MTNYYIKALKLNEKSWAYCFRFKKIKSYMLSKESGKKLYLRQQIWINIAVIL